MDAKMQAAEAARMLRRGELSKSAMLLLPDKAVAELVLNELWPDCVVGSRNEVMLSQVIERLRRANGGPLAA